MNQDNKSQKDKKGQSNALQKAEELLARAKKMNSDFKQKTDVLIKDINQGLDQAEKETDEIDKDLKKFEKETVNKIDKTVLDFVSDKGEEE